MCGVVQLIASFCSRTGRLLAFEVEPGTFLTANCGALLTTVQVNSSRASCVLVCAGVCE